MPRRWGQDFPFYRNKRSRGNQQINQTAGNVHGKSRSSSPSKQSQQHSRVCNALETPRLNHEFTPHSDARCEWSQQDNQTMGYAAVQQRSSIVPSMQRNRKIRFPHSYVSSTLEDRNSRECLTPYTDVRSGRNQQNTETSGTFEQQVLPSAPSVQSQHNSHFTSTMADSRLRQESPPGIDGRSELKQQDNQRQGYTAEPQISPSGPSIQNQQHSYVRSTMDVRDLRQESTSYSKGRSERNQQKNQISVHTVEQQKSPNAPSIQNQQHSYGRSTMDVRDLRQESTSYSMGRSERNQQRNQTQVYTVEQHTSPPSMQGQQPYHVNSYREARCERQKQTPYSDGRSRRNQINNQTPEYAVVQQISPSDSLTQIQQYSEVRSTTEIPHLRQQFNTYGHNRSERNQQNSQTQGNAAVHQGSPSTPSMQSQQHSHVRSTMKVKRLRQEFMPDRDDRSERNQQNSQAPGNAAVHQGSPSTPSMQNQQHSHVSSTMKVKRLRQEFMSDRDDRSERNQQNSQTSGNASGHQGSQSIPSMQSQQHSNVRAPTEVLHPQLSPADDVRRSPENLTILHEVRRQGTVDEHPVTILPSGFLVNGVFTVWPDNVIVTYVHDQLENVSIEETELEPETSQRPAGGSQRPAGGSLRPAGGLQGQARGLQRQAGMSKKDIARLPIRSFSPTASFSQNNCRICLEDFREGEVLMNLPCFHEFHEACVVKWLKETAVCPRCRHVVSVRE